MITEIGKRVLVRVDFNVPIENNQVVSDTRIKASVPLIQSLLKQQAGIVLISHLGRPQPGAFDPSYSLKPVSYALEKLLGQPVRFEQNWVDGLVLNPGEIVLGENVRFLLGETENDSQLAQKMAALADVFIMDAFASAHRAHASTCGVAQYAKVALKGPLIQTELDHIDLFLQDASKPQKKIAILGGAKIKDKIELIETLLKKVDSLLLGGGIANTFLLAKGIEVGASLVEKSFVAFAQNMLEFAQKKQKHIFLPEEVVVESGLQKSIHTLEKQDQIFDIGLKTQKVYQQTIAQATQLVWNGPMGVFENPNFSKGTQAVAQAVCENPGYCLAGGGQTIAAIEKFSPQANISFLSTGGGAFLSYLAEKKLPGLEYLQGEFP